VKPNFGGTDKKKKKRPQQQHHPQPQSTTSGSARKYEVLELQQSSGRRGDSQNTPPQSSSRTAVWHWELEGKPVTIMISKHGKSLKKDDPGLWCNETIEKVTTRNDDPAYDGGVITFDLVVSGFSHQAKITRSLTGQMDQPFRYKLYVDSCNILEHAPRPSLAQQHDDSPFDDDDEDDDEFGHELYGHGPYHFPEKASATKRK